MTKRFCDTEIWQKDWFLNLSDTDKLLTKFVFDNCDCAGIYEISWKMLRIFFNSQITKENFKKIKQLKFLDDNTIFIEDFVLFQCGISSLNALNPNNNAHKGIIKRLEKYNLILGANEGLTRGYIAPQEKEKEKEKEKDNNNLSSFGSFLLSDEIENFYGEYKNVYLTKNNYDKLKGFVLNDSVFNELINELSEQIAQKNERYKPYDDKFPNAHFIYLRNFWKFRKNNPKNFNAAINNNDDYAAALKRGAEMYKNYKEQKNEFG